MMAADQPEKINVFLKRGAKVNAVTYGGNAESLAVLLDGGIPVEPSRKVRFDATALAVSLITNNSSMTKLLLERKADANRGYRLLGGPPVVPLLSATSTHNRESIRALVKAGARLENANGTGMTVLSWAALSHKADSAAELSSLGAKQDVKDKLGLTPIEHIAAISESPASSTGLLKKR